MTHCRECAKQISEKATFCRYCGARQSEPLQKPARYADVTDDRWMVVDIVAALTSFLLKFSFGANKTLDYRMGIKEQQIADLLQLCEGSGSSVTEIDHHTLFERIRNDIKEIENIFDEYQHIFEGADYLFKKYGLESVDFKLLKHNGFYVDDLKEELEKSDCFEDIIEKYEERIQKYREDLTDYTDVIHARLDEVYERIEDE